MNSRLINLSKVAVGETVLDLVDNRVMIVAEIIREDTETVRLKFDPRRHAKTGTGTVRTRDKYKRI